MRTGGPPDWVLALGADACGRSPIAWEGWHAEVVAYCTIFEAIHPKRDQQEWRERWSDEYGKPILRARHGTERTVAEFEVIEAFRSCGWDANWQDSFGAAPAWMKPWTRADSPAPGWLSNLLTSIRSESPKARPWDVLAWRGEDVAFVECKAPHERFTKAESAFIHTAARAGIATEWFAVLRGEITYPDRPQATRR